MQQKLISLRSHYDRIQRSEKRLGAVQVDLAVARALELLKDDLVHARSGVDQDGGQDGHRSAVLDHDGIGGAVCQGPGLLGEGLGGAG